MPRCFLFFAGFCFELAFHDTKSLMLLLVYSGVTSVLGIHSRKHTNVRNTTRNLWTVRKEKKSSINARSTVNFIPESFSFFFLLVVSFFFFFSIMCLYVWCCLSDESPVRSWIFYNAIPCVPRVYNFLILWKEEK